MKPKSYWTQEEKDQFWADQDIEPKDILEEFDEDLFNDYDDYEDTDEQEEYWEDE